MNKADLARRIALELSIQQTLNKYDDINDTDKLLDIVQKIIENELSDLVIVFGTVYS